MLKKLNVFDLVFRGINAEEIWEMDNFCDVSDVIAAEVDVLQVDVRSKIGA